MNVVKDIDCCYLVFHQQMFPMMSAHIPPTMSRPPCSWPCRGRLQRRSGCCKAGFYDSLSGYRDPPHCQAPDVPWSEVKDYCSHWKQDYKHNQLK